MKVLVMNAGSSSLKFALFETSRKGPVSLRRGHFDNRGKPIRDFRAAVSKALVALDGLFNASRLAAVGHRVVHGGEKYTRGTLITPSVIREIRMLSSLAPLHNPPNLACILACREILGNNVPQAAVFDTAFHHTMPPRAFLYGLPAKIAEKFGIRRYGFHGTSHQYVFEQAQAALGQSRTRRTVTCHLGNGCSITAIRNGRVIDTSMGFTPLEGVPMGTRPGDLDAGAILELLEKGFTKKELSYLLNNKSGLLGVSGISSDMRDLLEAAQSRGSRGLQAKKTLDWFCYRIAKYIGSYAVALGGLDCVVFTGGIGENAPSVRATIMRSVRAIGKPRVIVIPTDEEKKIAQETAKILAARNHVPKVQSPRENPHP